MAIYVLDKDNIQISFTWCGFDTSWQNIEKAVMFQEMNFSSEIGMSREGELGEDSPIFTAAVVTLVLLAVFQVHYLSNIYSSYVN